MRRAIPVIAILLALVAAGCGGDEDETTVTETVTEEATGAEIETGTSASPAEGPQGELSRLGIGSVEVGMTTAEVKSAFGSPDREREVPGCPLAGPSAPPILQWTWKQGDGEVILDFGSGSEELISYRTTSGELATTAGARVGDSFEALRQAYGARLKPLPLGAPPTESIGFWRFGDQAKGWQLFDIRGGKVRNIQGGSVQICE